MNAIKYKNNREHETGDETGDEIKDNAIMKFEVYVYNKYRDKRNDKIGSK